VASDRASQGQIVEGEMEDREVVSMGCTVDDGRVENCRWDSEVSRDTRNTNRKLTITTNNIHGHFKKKRPQAKYWRETVKEKNKSTATLVPIKTSTHKKVTW